MPKELEKKLFEQRRAVVMKLDALMRSPLSDKKQQKYLLGLIDFVNQKNMEVNIAINKNSMPSTEKDVLLQKAIEAFYKIEKNCDRIQKEKHEEIFDAAKKYPAKEKEVSMLSGVLNKKIHLLLDSALIDKETRAHLQKKSEEIMAMCDALEKNVLNNNKMPVKEKIKNIDDTIMQFKKFDDELKKVDLKAQQADKWQAHREEVKPSAIKEKIKAFEAMSVEQKSWDAVKAQPAIKQPKSAEKSEETIPDPPKSRPGPRG